MAAHFLAGLAVECLLRAYAAREGATFDQRHDLRIHDKQAKFTDGMAQKAGERCGSALTTVYTRWQSEHRYCSDRFLSAFFHKARLDTGIKGDRVKEITRQTVDAALVLVEAGKVRW